MHAIRETSSKSHDVLERTTDFHTCNTTPSHAIERQTFWDWSDTHLSARPDLAHWVLLKVTVRIHSLNYSKYLSGQRFLRTPGKMLAAPQTSKQSQQLSNRNFSILGWTADNSHPQSAVLVLYVVSVRPKAFWLRPSLSTHLERCQRGQPWSNGYQILLWAAFHLLRHDIRWSSHRSTRQPPHWQYLLPSERWCPYRQAPAAYHHNYTWCSAVWVTVPKREPAGNFQQHKQYSLFDSCLMKYAKPSLLPADHSISSLGTNQRSSIFASWLMRWMQAHCLMCKLQC